MRPDQWELVHSLFREALALPRDRRAGFVRDRCGGDEEVRREVESLFEHHEMGGAGASIWSPSARLS